MNLALMIVCIGLSGLFAWASRQPQIWAYHRGRLVGGSIVAAMLAVLCGYFHFKEVQAPGELAEIIPVYPSISEVSWVPPVSEERYWLLESDDPAESVVAFYEGVAREESWSLAREDGGRLTMLTLERDGVRVFLTVTAEAARSKLAYQVSTVSTD